MSDADGELVGCADMIAGGDAVVDVEVTMTVVGGVFVLRRISIYSKTEKSGRSCVVNPATYSVEDELDIAAVLVSLQNDIKPIHLHLWDNLRDDSFWIAR